MIIALLLAGVVFCASSVFCFYKANFCACTRAGQCNNPVNHFWLAAISNALIALLFCCLALQVNVATLVWLTLMISCALGAYISSKQKQRRHCIKAAANRTAAVTPIKITK
jgi:hypothetical protein